MSDPASSDRIAIGAATLNIIHEVSETQPVLLVIDDYQWLDSATQSVVSFLAPRSQHRSFGLLIATREEALTVHRGRDVTLDPLTTEAAAALLNQRGQLSSRAIARVMALAAGNPLALEELPLSLTPDQLEGPASLANPVSVSAAVRRAFRARFDGLPLATQRAVLYAAEGSGEPTDSVVRAIEREGLERDALEPAVAAGLLSISGSAIRFRHPLVRSVIHQMTGASELREVHRTLAAAADDPDRRAWHRAVAAVGPDEDVAAALEEAGERALARGAAASAASALQRAAELSLTETDRTRRIGAAARAAHRAGNMTLTAELIVDARRLAGTAQIDAQLVLLEADIRMRRGDFSGAYGALRIEADHIAAYDPGRAATMLLLASKMRVYRFEADLAVKEVDEALRLVPEADYELVHLASVAMTRTMAGHQGARRALLKALDAAMAAPHGHTYTLGIGWPLVWLEEYERARAFISRSTNIQTEGGHLAYLPQALLPLAELDYRTGRWDVARANASEAFRLFTESQQPTEAAVAATLLARLAAATGDHDEVQHFVDIAAASDLSSGLKAATAHAEAALGLADLGAGRYLDAVEHLRRVQAITLAGGIGEPWLLPFEADLAEALARSSDPLAYKVALDLTQVGEVLGRRSAIAAGLRCQGLLAEEGSFRDLFERAIAIHEELPTPFEQARTELCYGERLRRARHRVEARSRLRQALSVFERLGAEPWAARAAAELSASGEVLQRGPSLSELTPQERQVARIVASGATNREAAELLFVSPKTVEFHLGNVYRKLGVRSRTELANALGKSGSAATSLADG
jgi:DNA-binding CsgD family transcriptional regulator